MTTKTDLPLSLAAWSCHKMFFDGSIDQLGMVRLAGELGFGAFEMVNSFFPSPQYAYLQKLKAQASDAGVALTLIMVDAEGSLAAADRAERRQAVVNHRKWIDIASVLGCRWIRVNLGGDQASPGDFRDRAAESLLSLLNYCAGQVDVILENHWGPSSDPDWLVSLVEAVADPHLGTLPDFGNFPDEIDRYDAVAKMMPYARAVSAKCYDFDDATGDETKIDFAKMIQIVRSSGFSGYIGVEYEGSRLGEREGIVAGKKLLERLVAP